MINIDFQIKVTQKEEKEAVVEGACIGLYAVGDVNFKWVMVVCFKMYANTLFSFHNIYVS